LTCESLLLKKRKFYVDKAPYSEDIRRSTDESRQSQPSHSMKMSG